jgi:tRNA (mo5U34)-methyltransferase
MNSEPYLKELIAQCPALGIKAIMEQRFATLAELLSTGNCPRWLQVFTQLPEPGSGRRVFDENAVRFIADHALNSTDLEVFKSQLLAFSPWRKGPYELNGVFIDSEWQSFMKWNRIKGRISPLKNRRVLDIGGGSGYYLYRMVPEQPTWMVSVDPSALFFYQFLVLQKYLQIQNMGFAPLGIEDLSPLCDVADTLFFMGVLYHRRSPLDCLTQLHRLLSSEGELILETLYIDGDDPVCLCPEERYAVMRNVWFIPTISCLLSWLSKTGFKNCEVLDTSTTSFDEQRSTEWMGFQSLKDFLNPLDPTRTLEGYPAPKRVVIKATKNI